MELKVCKNCRRLFKYIYGPELCQDCLKSATKVEEEPSAKSNVNTVKAMVKEEEDKFLQVKDYILANPRATIVQIAEANDIAPSKLFDWIRDDKLEFSEDSKDAWFECMKCGRKIKSGRLCNACKVR